MINDMSNEDLKFHIKGLDKDGDIIVSDWEADFIESVLRCNPIYISSNMKNKCIDILNKYSTGEYYK